MSLVGFSTWKNQLMVQLPGAIDVAVRQEFALTAMDFYRRTRSWKEKLRTRPNTTTGIVPLEPVSDYASIVFLEGAREVDRDAPLPVAPNQNGWDILVPGYQYTVRLRMIDPHTLTVVPPSDDPLDLEIELSLQPKLGTAPLLPAWAVTHHFDALLSGTLARMFRHPKKPYTDPGLSEQHRRIYERSVVNAVGMDLHNYSGRPVPWRYPNVPRR